MATQLKTYETRLAGYEKAIKAGTATAAEKAAVPKLKRYIATDKAAVQRGPTGATSDHGATSGQPTGATPEAQKSAAYAQAHPYNTGAWGAPIDLTKPSNDTYTLAQQWYYALQNPAAAMAGGSIFARVNQSANNSSGATVGEWELGGLLGAIQGSGAAYYGAYPTIPSAVTNASAKVRSIAAGAAARQRSALQATGDYIPFGSQAGPLAPAPGTGPTSSASAAPALAGGTAPNSSPITPGGSDSGYQSNPMLTATPASPAFTGGAVAAPGATTTPAPASGGGLPIGTLLLAGGAILLVVVLITARKKRK